MVTKAKVQPGLAIPPGYLIVEELEARGISQAELARRMGRPKNAVNEICKGKKEITAQTALELEAVLGIDAETWMNLEGSYRLALARGKPHIDQLEEMKPAED
ncbi:MAG TPA: HigA family addiction module antitoxin [Dehalococcoidia bacterium]|nr:HigA family addiction module antitoxin [Dehalococcoidia bacterium]